MNIPISVQAGPLPKIVEPLQWLIGTWRCENLANGTYPTIKDFNYGEEITFRNVVR